MQTHYENFMTYAIALKRGNPGQADTSASYTGIPGFSTD